MQLRDTVALVTGSTRGVGRGIAVALGGEGATVYVTGRSSSAGSSTEGLPGTVESVAQEVTARGGRGIGVACDLRRQEDVSALMQRIREEQGGRLDLLVNNVWRGYEERPNGIRNAPFWELDAAMHWERMFEGGLQTHLRVTSAAARELMVPAKKPALVVNTIAWAEGKYLLQLYYDLAKQAIVRMSYGMALELKRHDVAVVALAPGFVRSERVMAAHAAQPFDLSGTESPEYIGRAVVALTADHAGAMARSGQVLTAGRLAKEYGFTDVDGRVIPPFEMPPALALD